jgi:hypothetical protein
MYNDFSNNSLRYSKLTSLYLSSNKVLESYNYGTLRQQGSSSLASNNYNDKGFETKALAKLMSYNFGVNPLDSNGLFPGNIVLPNKSSAVGSLQSALEVSSPKTLHSLSSLNESGNPNHKYALGLTTDGKYYSNPFKYYGGTFANFSQSHNLFTSGDKLGAMSNPGSPVTSLGNVNQSYKFQDLKSSNLSFLSPDKNVRSLEHVSPSKNLFNLLSEPNNMLSISSHSVGEKISPSELGVFTAAQSN